MDIFRKISGRITIQIFCFLFLMGCLSQIEIDADLRSNQLVISGQVSTLLDQTFVQVGRTAGTSRLPVPVSGATVILYGENNAYPPWIESTSRPGEYRPQNFLGAPGATYNIQIILPEGSIYESVPETVPSTLGTDEVYYTFEENEFVDAEGTVSTLPYFNLYNNAALPDQAEGLTYLRWTVEECYVIRPTDFPDPFSEVPPPCYILQAADPQRVVLLNGAEVKGTHTGELLLASRPVDRSFHDRHYFTTYQTSMTEEAHEYWRKIDIIANQTGSIFDTPPGAVNGNVFSTNNEDEIVFGYFQVVNQSYTRFFVVPSDVTVPMTFGSCTYLPGKSIQNYPKECLSCITIRNSSYERPWWF